MMKSAVRECVRLADDEERGARASFFLGRDFWIFF